jgi:hypothetical protein
MNLFCLHSVIDEVVYSLYSISSRIQKRSILSEVIVLVILSKKVYMYMCTIPNGFQDRAIQLYSSKTVDKERDVLFLIPVFIVPMIKLVQFT